MLTQSGTLTGTLAGSLVTGDSLSYRITVIDKLMPGNAVNYISFIETGTKVYNLRKEIGFTNVITIVFLMIRELCKCYNVSKNMTTNQAKDFAITLVEKYSQGTGENPGLTIEDFAAFFEKARRGEYGKPFDYIDATLIESWLTVYRSDRYEAILKRHEELKNMKPERPKKEDLNKLNNFTIFMNKLRESIQRAQEKQAEDVRLKREQEKQRVKDIAISKAKRFWGEDWEKVQQQIQDEKTGKISGAESPGNENKQGESL